MKTNILRAEGRVFFDFVNAGELEAYKLTEKQAINFCSKSLRTEELPKLEPDELYDGFVALNLQDGFWVGKIDGKFIWLNPEIWDMKPFTNHPCSTSGKRVIYTDFMSYRGALEKGYLFEYHSENREPCQRLLSVRDLDVADALKHDRRFRDPDGDPEEIDKQVKDKLVAFIQDEPVEFSDEEMYLLREHFPMEYWQIFDD